MCINCALMHIGLFLDFGSSDLSVGEFICGIALVEVVYTVWTINLILIAMVQAPLIWNFRNSYVWEMFG